MANKTLVIAVDNSKECHKAVDFAVDHFPSGYTYHLVHVMARPLGPGIIASAAAAEFAYEKIEAVEADMVAASEEFLKNVFAPKAKAGGAEVVAVVIAAPSDSSSHVGAAICEYAEKVQADVLVLMKQNKSAISRFFLGSVTKYCAVHSPIPVAIVPNTP